MSRRARVCLSLFAVAVCLAAQPSPPPVAVTQREMESLRAAVRSAQSAGDNAWMLTSAALVLMMTGPGLALF